MRVTHVNTHSRSNEPDATIPVSMPPALLKYGCIHTIMTEVTRGVWGVGDLTMPGNFLLHAATGRQSQSPKKILPLQSALSVQSSDTLQRS